METIAHIFRIPGNGKPISTFQLAGIPSEVVNSVVSVLCRMAFELALWSNGSIHMLVVCEEAHRYVPADQELGFVPTRQAIARIAKEGRKYGVSLGVITQRPGELDQTILSQCSTLFAMRLSNERDQDIIRSAMPNSSLSTMSFLSSIGNGEAIAFGEAIAVPMRMKFTRLAPGNLPKASTASNRVEDPTPGTMDLSTIVKRMRSKAGPDISNFQQSFEATYGAFEPDDPDVLGPETFDDLASDAELESWNKEMRSTVPDQSYEPYRPEMLPGSSALTRGQPSSASPAPSRNNSLRESLLKNPLGSLYRKD